MAEPTKNAVNDAMGIYRKLGSAEFLKLYSKGKNSRAHFVLCGGVIYPLKALWAAAHNPPIQTREFNTSDARKGFKGLKFETFIDGDLAKQYLEGQRVIREVSVLARSAGLVAKAKARSPAVCEACNFDFERTYGPLGRGFIECHHVDALSKRDGRSIPTRLDELAMLCSNCHRMIHRGEKCLTMAELREVLVQCAS